MEQKLLVVVSIIAGRNFPRRPECSLEIEARFNGEVLCTDPLPHAGGTMVIDNELAWEMTRKALQQHKLNRTPIKLQCYAVDGATKSRQNVGYVMLDLRTAHPKSKQLQEPNWYGVLNSAYSRLRPQLQIALTLEDEGQSSPPVSLPSQPQQIEDSVPSLSLTLDPSGGYYHLIPSPHSSVQPPLEQDQLMHTLSLTLSNAKQLPKLPAGQVQYYFYYCLLGNDITSEPFTPPVFSPERASIRLKSSRDLLSLLFVSQPDLEVHLCCGSDSVAMATLPLSSLASDDSIKSALKLNQIGASVDIVVQLEQVEELGLPTPSSAPPSHGPHPLQTSPKAPPTSAASVPKVTDTPPSGSRSARRNLTRSFEEASLNTPSSKATTRSNSAQSTPPPSTTVNQPPPESRETSTIDGTLAPPPDSTHSQRQRQSLSPPPVPSSTTAQSSTLHPTSQPLSTSVPQSVKPSQGVSLPTSADVLAQTSFSSSTTAPLKSILPASFPSVVHRYKFSVDLRSVHNTALDSTIKCYLRYSYPFFGCPYPVVVQPPVPLPLNVDQTFTQSYCSFEFATEPQQLNRHISGHPLVVEVWQSCEKSHDLNIGTSEIKLSEVLSVSKAVLEGGVTRQICSLRSPITPPPPSHHHTLTLGRINCVLVLEDHGPIARTTISSAPLSKPLPVSTHGLGSGAATSVTTAPYTTMMSLPASTSSTVSSISQVQPPSLTAPHPFSLPPTQTSWQTQQHPSVFPPHLPPASNAQTQTFHQNHRHPLGQLPPSSDPLTFHQNYRHPPPQLPPGGDPLTFRPNFRQPLPQLPPGSDPSTFHQNFSHPPTRLPFPSDAAGHSSVVGSVEYDVAMELEMWKLTEEEKFQEHLKEREKTHMAKLGEEWQRREEQRQQLLKHKLEHYSSLEKQLQEALEQVQAQQKQLSERETKYIREKDKLSQDRQLLHKELEGAVVQVKTQYQHQLEMERLRASELQSVIDSLKKQVRELESRLSSRETEFERYRQQIVAQPESKLQAELSIAQLEKVELERKLLALSKSKQHYKEQWSKTLSELAACRQREQAAARERLLTQQQELEMMRARYLQHEEQNSIRQQLHQVKNEVEQLQEQTLVQAQQKPSSPSAKPHPSSLAQNGGGHTDLAQKSAHLETSLADTNVARWVEERDILLQTGVYTSSDPTIQKLDLKIRQALAKHTNT